MLVGDLVAGASKDQPTRFRESCPVAEDEVDSPGEPGDEVVHVAFLAAVVAAAEDEPPVVVEQHPPREMDGVDAGEVVPGDRMTIGEVKPGQGHPHSHLTDYPGLDLADRREG